MIAYERPDRTEQRESRYQIVAIDQADQLKAALRSALGIKVVVAKERHLWMWEGIRIHLDQVDGLGNFVEFEAVTDIDDTDLTKAETRIEALREAFDIDDVDLVGKSYCDLAIANGDGRS